MIKVLKIIFWFSIALLGHNIFLFFAEIVPPSLTSFKENFGLYPKANLDYIRIKEGLFIGTTDADGRFGDNYTRDKRANRIRIGLVGDSYVQGTDVMSDLHFRRIMEDKLNEGLASKQYEVINLGRNNFNIPYSYHYYQNFGNQFNLDHVLYFMEERDFNAESLNKLSTYYEVKDGKLVANKDWQKTGTFQMLSTLDNTPLLKYYSDVPSINLLNRARMNVKIRGLNNIILGKFASLDLLLNRTEQNYSHHDEDYWSGQTENNQTISEVTKIIIDELLASTSPKVTVVTRNYPVKVKKLEQYLLSKDADVIKLSEIFDGPYIRGTSINANFFKASNLYGGHFNHHGHQALGVFLAEEMKERLDNN